MVVSGRVFNTTSFQFQSVSDYIKISVFVAMPAKRFIVNATKHITKGTV